MSEAQLPSKKELHAFADTLVSANIIQIKDLYQIQEYIDENRISYGAYDFMPWFTYRASFLKNNKLRITHLQLQDKSVYYL